MGTYLDESGLARVWDYAFDFFVHSDDVPVELTYEALTGKKLPSICPECEQESSYSRIVSEDDSFNIQIVCDNCNYMIYDSTVFVRESFSESDLRELLEDAILSTFQNSQSYEESSCPNCQSSYDLSLWKQDGTCKVCGANVELSEVLFPAIHKVSSFVDSDISVKYSYYGLEELLKVISDKTSGATPISLEYIDDLVSDD